MAAWILRYSYRIPQTLFFPFKRRNVHDFGKRTKYAQRRERPCTGAERLHEGRYTVEWDDLFTMVWLGELARSFKQSERILFYQNDNPYSSTDSPEFDKI